MIKYERKIILAMAGKLDINFKDENNRTIISSLIEENFFRRDLIYKIFKLGYSILDFNVIENGNVIPYKNCLNRFDYLDQFLFEDVIVKDKLYFLIKGGHCQTYLSFKGKEAFVIKESNHKLDIYKELIISKQINEKFPETCINIIGFHKQNSIIMEYGITTLEFFLKIIDDKDIVIKVFKNLILCVRKFNTMGYIHMDLKPNNILVFPDLSVRLLDFGLSIYKGYSNIIDTFVTTCVIKPPDDYLDEHFHIINDKRIKLCSDNSVNYSCDIYAIACILLKYVLNTKNYYHFLFLENKIYLYTRCQFEDISIVENTKLITQEKYEMIQSFSPLMINFLMGAFELNSSTRSTSCSSFPLFSIESCDFLTEFYNNYSQIYIPKKVGDYIYTSSDLDYCLNTRMILSTNNFQRYFMNSLEQNKSIMKLFSVNFIHNLPDEFSYKFKDYLNTLISLKYNFIFFEDLINLYVSMLERRNENQEKILIFNSNIVRLLYRNIPTNDGFYLFDFFENVFQNI